MPRLTNGGTIRPDEISVRLHDVATGLAIGISLLKGTLDGSKNEARPIDVRALGLFEDSLGQLRSLTAAVGGARNWQRLRPQLAESIRREGSQLRIRLELELSGKEEWLPPNLADLVLLVAREGLRNVRRHSGISTCTISIDLTSCPFCVRIRDWGAGLREGARPGSGIELLRRLAADAGCELGVASQPGLGTDLVLIGPLCTRDRAISSAQVAGARDSSSQAIDLTPAHGEHTVQRGQKRDVVSRLGG